MTPALYRERILDHFRHPRHRGSVEGMAAVGRGAIPLCGDEIEVGIRHGDGARLSISFRGRGCALCIASASMMAETLTDGGRDRADRFSRAFVDWMLEGATPTALELGAPELVETFRAVRAAGNRAHCAALPWMALRDALSQG
jgi:nitrogen fixation NifU-like protein